MNEIGAAIRAVRSVCDLPIVAQVTTEEDGNSLDGAAPETFVPELERAGRRRRRPELQRRPGGDARDASSGWRASRTVKLSAQPNAGRPREIEGRNIYLCSPEYMASYARRFINTGVRLVGGCCGTTPEHIRHIKMAVRALAPATRRVPRRRRRSGAGDRGRRRCADPVPRAEKSRMAQRAGARRRSSSASSWCRRAASAPTRCVEQARQLRIRGVDLVNIPDGPRAERAHERAVGGACWSSSRPASRRSSTTPAAIETCSGCSRTCSARTRWASATCCSSPAIRRRSATIRTRPRVFDVDSIGLTNVVTRLNRGIDIGGQTHRRADRVPHRRRRQSRRARSSTRSCGASRTRSRRAPSSRSPSRCSMPTSSRAFLAPHRGVPDSGARRRSLPLESLRHAEFMANEVPGRARARRGRRADARAPTRTGAPRPKGWRSRARSRPRSGRWCRAFRFRRRARGDRGCARASSRRSTSLRLATVWRPACVGRLAPSILTGYSRKRSPLVLDERAVIFDLQIRRRGSDALIRSQSRSAGRTGDGVGCRDPGAVGDGRRERFRRRRSTTSSPRSTTSPSGRRSIPAGCRRSSGWTSSRASACSRSASAPASTCRSIRANCSVTGIDFIGVDAREGARARRAEGHAATSGCCRWTPPTSSSPTTRSTSSTRRT